MVPAGKVDLIAVHDSPEESVKLRRKRRKFKESVMETGQTMHIITIKSL